MPLFFDPTIIVLIPAIIIAFYAQMKVQSTFKQYSKVPLKKGMTGAQAAQLLLREAGIDDVRIEPTKGELTDHYDPRTKVLRLSQSVYDKTSVAAVGVAAHETGHAIQHHIGYFPLELRNLIVPVAGFGSNLAFPLLILGLIFGNYSLAMAGVWVFVAVVAFQLITLPVEYNASNRAVAILEGSGLIDLEERTKVKKVLGAAALTYVAATLMAVLNLVRMLLLVGFINRN